VYRFVAHERGVPAARMRFRCSFDRPRLHRCRARYRQRLALGRHVLRVRAVDPAGRQSRLTRVVVRIVPGTGPRLGKIDVTIFEGEGEGLLRDLASPTAQQALEQMSAFVHQHLG